MTFKSEAARMEYIFNTDYEVVARDMGSAGVDGWDYIMHFKKKHSFKIKVPQGANMFLFRHVLKSGVWLLQGEEFGQTWFLPQVEERSFLKHSSWETAVLALPNCTNNYKIKPGVEYINLSNPHWSEKGFGNLIFLRENH